MEWYVVCEHASVLVCGHVGLSYSHWGAHVRREGA
jgi:hypothetical protein